MTKEEEIARKDLGWKCELYSHEQKLWDAALEWASTQAEAHASGDDKGDLFTKESVSLAIARSIRAGKSQ